MIRFGKYEVVDEIGEGGFGKVYKGWDPALKRHVAIKTCTWSDPMFRRRFVQEAELAGGLQHPNIVTVHDFGEERGEPYLVQEFLDGADLDELIERGEPASLEEKLDVLRQTAAGLAHAHDRGVVHRDVKPSNIRVRADGGVSIMDFGIAKLLNDESGLTQTGVSIGTAGYMSPEQLEGGEVDARADIFSFGVVAYELIAGERPFTGDTVSSLFYQIVNVDPAPLTERRPDCPNGLARLVARCLEKDPDSRYGSFHEIQRELIAPPGTAARPDANLSPPAPAPPPLAATIGHPAAGSPPRRAGKPPESPVANDRGPAREGSRRATPRAAYAGLVVAAAAVAAFGILNLVGTSRSSPVVVGDSLDIDGSGGQQVDTAGPLPPDPIEGGDQGDDPSPEEDPGPRDDGGPDDPEPDDPAGPVDLDGVLVVVYGAEPSSFRAAENVILSRLADAGHAVLDEVGAELRAEVETATDSPHELGRAAGAAVLVIGELSTDAVSSVGGMFTGSAALSIRTFDIASGAVLLTRTFRVGADNVPGELGGTPDAARTEAATRVGHQAAAALRARLAAPP
ncbi:MAG: serine/threonine-protein kinase [Gemmatimonadota bacterium]|nr:serine/threonine-protein kinase [Gemmatimonadota bacterium]